MKLPNELALLNRLLNQFEYKSSPTGLIRITLWTLFFLTVISQFLPQKNISLKKEQVALMINRSNSSEWIRSDLKKFPKENDLNIAWVSDSSIILGNKLKKRYLPEIVNYMMASNSEVIPHSFVYSAISGRILDTYGMVNDALAREPDVLVLTLNPFWAYNNKAVFFRKALFNHGAKAWWNSSDWMWQFTLVTPSNHLFNILGRHFSVIANRKKLLKKLTPTLTKFKKIQSKTNQIKFRQPSKFWLLFQSFNGNIEKIYTKRKMNVNAWQLAAISQANTSDETWNSELLNNIMLNIKKSNIPTLIYVAPIASNMTDREALNSYENVLNAVDLLKNRFENDRIKFIISFPDEIYNSLNHRDYLHLKDPGKLPAFLAQQISGIRQ